MLTTPAKPLLSSRHICLTLPSGHLIGVPESNLTPAKIQSVCLFNASRSGALELMKPTPSSSSWTGTRIAWTLVLLHFFNQGTPPDLIAIQSAQQPLHCSLACPGPRPVDSDTPSTTAKGIQPEVKWGRVWNCKGPGRSPHRFSATTWPSETGSPRVGIPTRKSKSIAIDLTVSVNGLLLSKANVCRGALDHCDP